MRILSIIRNILEGLDYLVHRPDGLQTAMPDYNRWRRSRGLTRFRQAWWWQTRLESYASLRHYAFLLDWAVSSICNGQKTNNQEPRTTNKEPKTKNLPSHARVIVIRMGHLGDILHLMPTMREIRRQRPGWKLELVTGPWSRTLAESFRLFDAVHVYGPDVVQYHRGDRSQTRSMDTEKAWIQEVRGSGADVVFCPSSLHFSEMPVAVGLGASWYVGEPWPLDQLPHPATYSTRPFDSRHYEMDAVADFLPLMGLERPAVSLAYPLESDAKARAKTWLREHAGDGKLALLFPGSGWPGKNWPPEAFARLADDLIKQKKVAVALAGSPGEVSLCEQVRLRMSETAHNLAGQFSLADTAALIAQSALVIGNDSAPVHIAAALDVPTVSLWGPTFPEKWAPRGPGHVAVKATEPCAGCLYWHVNAKCQRRPGCIISVKYADVVDAVRRVLG